MEDRRFTFFESYREVAELMNDEERLAFYDALIGYGITGEEPDELEGSALIAFKMARPSLDKSARRARANARNARKRARSEGEPGQTDSEPEPAATAPEPVQAEPETNHSEQPANASEPKRTCGETERNGANASETERNETVANGSLSFAFPDIDIDIDIDKDKDDDKDTDEDEPGGRHPPHRPTADEWWHRWEEACAKRGIPAIRYEADEALAYYEANGWRQNNGNPIKRWGAALTTCLLRAHPELKTRDQGAKHDAFAAYD